MSSSDYIARLVHPEDRPTAQQEKLAAHAARPVFAEYRIVRPDGEVRWLLPCGRITKVEGGKGVVMIGGVLDVTAQRKTAEHLRHAQKLDVIGGLTTGVAHNFNNMLAIIQPALELALERPAPAHKQALQDALHAAHRAAELVNQLMTFAGQRRAAAPSSLDLVPLFEHTIAMCRRMFDRRVRIDAMSELSAAQVSGDPQSIEQVLMNLLINARDAVSEVNELEPREPYIRVTLSEDRARHPDIQSTSEQTYFRIRIEDNGIGMSDAVKQHLFEPFFTTKKPGKGTGLGLATSYGIVREAGGFIVLESQPREGTSISVFLPPAAACGATPHVSDHAVSHAPRGTILVFDDEPALRHIIELLLRERGHRVHVAPNGPSGVAKLEAGLRPDVILLDRSMPGWPAKLTLHEIRRHAELVPVVFFTGQDVTDEERSQVQDVLYEPLSNAELVRCVERWLAHAQRR